MVRGRRGIFGLGLLDIDLSYFDEADWRREVTNPDRVHPAVLSEMPRVVARARAAGARGPLEFVGAGGFAVVLCDPQDVAWKVFRTRDPSTSQVFLRQMLADEYEFLRDAATTPAAPNVVRVFASHPRELVLERECVRGRPGTFAEGRELSDLLKRIEGFTLPVGWTAPEFKEDSFIIRPDGTAVLVDISLTQRVGDNLARFVEDVLDGRRATSDSWHTLAFLVAREGRNGPAKGGLPEARARELLARLGERDPLVRRDYPPDRPL